MMAARWWKKNVQNVKNVIERHPYKYIHIASIKKERDKASSVLFSPCPIFAKSM